MKSKNPVWFTGMLVAFILAVSNFGCGGGHAAIPISVSVSPTSTTVETGATQQFTATVQNDPANSGVTWSISPATGAGTLTNMNSTSVTYSAPAAPPANNLSATIVATSVADTSKSASATISVPAIVVTVSPPGVTLQPGGTQQFTATVSNDPSSKGVTWTVSCSAAACGTVSPTATASGAATTYTAPSTTSLSGLTVTLTATSVTDTSKSASATITVPGVTVSVMPSSASLQAGATQQFTATVSNDPTNSGVTWTLTQAGTACSPGCGTIAPTATASGSPITYTAPATPPPSNLTLSVAATSVALSSASASATVTVLAITVSVAPISALLPGGTTQPFTATVSNDPANAGVTWALTQNGAACSTTCGTMSSTTANPVTYSAPATVSAGATVTLAATSVTDTTKSAAAAIMLTIGTVKIVPDSLDFGSVPKHHTSSPQATTLTNTANTTLNITGIKITGANPSDFSIQSNNCGTRVLAGNSCTIAVTFTPGFTGPFSAAVTVSDNSPDSPQQVSLSGTGLRSIRGFLRSALADSRTAIVPNPSGPNPVGTRVIDQIDSSREDPYLANGTKRELLVRFWYPGSLSQGCKLAQYTSPAVWKYFSKLVGIPLPEVRTNACQDAPITDGLHPVVVFTPGYTCTFTDYTFIFEDLASRGYVVASVDHTYEATAVEFPDGRFVESIFGSYLGNNLRSDHQALTTAVSVRLGDLELVADELERLNVDTGSPFVGKLDTTRMALAGHSLGGLTAILGVEREPRFRAAINLDGGVPDGLITPTDAPVLVLAAGREWWSENDRRLWEKLRGPRVAVNLKGSEHVTPSDALWLAPGAIMSGTMGPEKTINAIRDYIAAFLYTHLRDAPMHPLLTGPSSNYPDVTVITQSESLRERR